MGNSAIGVDLDTLDWGEMVARRGCLLALALTAVLVTGLVPGRQAQAVAAQVPPAPPTRGPVVGARFAILVEEPGGAVMWQRNPTAPRAPASLTKMLTAVTVRASLPMSRRLITSPAAARTPPNRLNLRAGEDLTVAQALTALMMVSANDVAVVLAAHAAGSVPRFARAMDAQGRRLGLRRSAWRNPHGLDERGHRSTAYDLAILARAVLRDPWLATTVARRERVGFRAPDGTRHSLWNKGHFLRGYPDAIGVKTGFTDDAGRCVAAAASRGGRTLLAVVLDSPDPAKDAGQLMDWGFGQGRSARTGLRLPAYVAPASVTDLLPAPVAAPPAALPVAPTMPAPAAAPASSRGPAVIPLGVATGLATLTLATLTTFAVRLRRTRRRLAVVLETRPPGPGRPTS